jgi:phosphoribosyl 1,2-cyclic phosphodiesterase
MHQTADVVRPACISKGRMFVQSFGSGSSGNALLIRSRSAFVLVDCGLSPRSLNRALAHHGTSLGRLDAILLTHEHDDHVRGLVGARAAGVPMIATDGTAYSLGLEPGCCQRMAFDQQIRIENLEVTALATSHDAAQPCGFSISDGSVRLTILTDLGETTDAYADLICDSQLIVIEANHDVHMLKSGPYPEHLKRRVLSARGHLSNDDCGRFLYRCLGKTSMSKTVWLAHLSATNNRPALAVDTVQTGLAGARHRHLVTALPRREVGPIWHPALNPVTQMSLFD